MMISRTKLEPIQQASRVMAGYLFEYAMPGLRRPTTTTTTTSPPIILASTQYKKIDKLFQKLETMYNEPAFEEYVVQHHHAHVGFHPRLLNVEFHTLTTHYRCSYHIFDWMHKGNNNWRMGNFRRRQASHLWIMATDEERRNCLLNVDQQSSLLNDATKLAYGQKEFHILIQKRLKRLMWQCEEAFLTREQPQNYNFTLHRQDALYLVNLYDLPKRISYE